MNNKKEVRMVQTIEAPRFDEGVFTIKGAEGSPLVVHRFSEKAKKQMEDGMTGVRLPGTKKKREIIDPKQEYEMAKYVSKEGWEGFNASAIRNAMISACRLVGFKMTLAKLSIFVVQDGQDKFEPQIPLVKINGNSVLQRDINHVETGQAYLTFRPAYHNWSAKVRIRWDAKQFNANDITNLLARVGMQVGLCEGRPDSKHSAGMGWGLFNVQ
jgi:hypothetical protein